MQKAFNTSANQSKIEEPTEITFAALRIAALCSCHIEVILLERW